MSALLPFIVRVFDRWAGMWSAVGVTCRRGRLCSARERAVVSLFSVRMKGKKESSSIYHRLMVHQLRNVSERGLPAIWLRRRSSGRLCFLT